MAQKPKTVLIVDADAVTRDAIGDILRREYRVMRVATGEAALTSVGREDVDLALVDVRLPGITGLELLRILRENYPLVEVVMISSAADLDSAVQAIKHGAYHYVLKTVDQEDLRTVVRNASDHQDLTRRVLTLSAEVGDQGNREFVVGSSNASKELVDLVSRVAPLPATVLLLGESGTGKELLARRIHRESATPEGPFIAVNMAAIPRDLAESTLFGHEKGAFTGAVRQQLGKFELAAGGTLFLDEIGDLALDLQAKLLRALQEGEIERVGGEKPIRTHFRLVAATNTNLEDAKRAGRFREDLFYRLNVIPVTLPPLRERPDDVAALAEFFLARYNTRFRKHVRGIAPQAIQVLRHYRWPGNVRELEHVIERLVAVSDRDYIAEEDLPIELQLTGAAGGDARGPGIFEQASETFERNLILRSLATCGWNVTGTATYLGLPLSTLKYKMVKLGVRQLAKKARGL